LINIHLELDQNGCLKYLKVSGHESHKQKGQALICAAVTFLVRTVAHILTSKKELMAFFNAPEPGCLEIKVNAPAGKWQDWLKGISETLVTGILDLQGEYPEMIAFNK
jgi:uncharacterized protein YsxB (DUF464 family)